MSDPIGTFIVILLAVVYLALVCSSLALAFALAIAIVRRRPPPDDPYRAPFGDVPNTPSGRRATQPDAGGGSLFVLSGPAAARAVSIRDSRYGK